MFYGSAEYSESHFDWFGKGSVSAESHFDWFGKGSVWPKLILAGSVHHYVGVFNKMIIPTVFICNGLDLI